MVVDGCPRASLITFVRGPGKSMMMMNSTMVIANSSIAINTYCMNEG